LTNQESVLKSLSETAIQAGIQYPFAVHELDTDKSLEFHQEVFPVLESINRQCFSLPIYAKMPIEVIPWTADILNHSAYY